MLNYEVTYRIRHCNELLITVIPRSERVLSKCSLLLLVLHFDMIWKSLILPVVDTFFNL